MALLCWAKGTISHGAGTYGPVARLHPVAPLPIATGLYHQSKGGPWTEFQTCAQKYLEQIGAAPDAAGLEAVRLAAAGQEGAKSH